ncbi:hypothetical protein GIB67_000134, partial [Kingdonia uniflora]
MTPHEYPGLSDVALASVGCMPLARRAREDGWYTPTARPCTPHGPLFRCTPGTVESVPARAVSTSVLVLYIEESMAVHRSKENLIEIKQIKMESMKSNLIVLDS